MRSKLLVAGLVVIAILVVGCGSGGGDTSESTGSGNEGTNKQSVSTPSPEETQFKYGANEICLNVPRTFVPAKEKLEKELKKKGKPLPPIAEINEKYAIPPLRVAVADFEKLTPIKGKEQQAEELVEALAAATKGMEEKPTAPFGGAGSPFVEFAELSKKAGLEACARL